uniref:Uncharacterized protein n=3 Tax=Nothobranchius furzeri TaxID=105023 RepID=A0A8C6LWT9_NOTFU
MTCFPPQPAMPLKPFSFPVPETRFFKAGSFIYKFKIRGGTGYSGKRCLREQCFNQELEVIVREVLGNLNNLRPFSTTHYTVFPYMKHWDRSRRCPKKNMRFYPFTIVLFLEKNMHRGEMQTDEVTKDVVPSEEPAVKCRHTDSPLEEAILKELKDMEAESSISATGNVNLEPQPAEKEVREDSTLSDEPEMTQDPQLKMDVERTPERPGILMQLARNVLPFLFRTRETHP